MYKRSFALLFSIIILISLFIKYMLSLYVLVINNSILDNSNYLIPITILICVILALCLIVGVLALKYRNIRYMIIQIIMALILTVIIFLNDKSNIMLFIVIDILIAFSIKTQKGYNKDE